MKVLIACEYSGRVRDAFIAKGHDAISCDLLPTEQPGPHYQGDIFDLCLSEFDLMVCHPPCTFLTIAAEWAYKPREEIKRNVSEDKLYGAERLAARELAADFFMRLANAPIPKIAIENPVGVMSSRWRKPDQYIQPYEYGHDASKKTCLWLKGLPQLIPTSRVEPRMMHRDGKPPLPRWGNQADCGADRTPPGPDRWKIRSTTWQGWADAMAEQWG